MEADRQINFKGSDYGLETRGARSVNHVRLNVIL